MVFQAQRQRSSTQTASSFEVSNEETMETTEWPLLPMTRPTSSSSILSTRAGSLAAGAQLVEEYISNMELYPQQQAHVTVSRSSQTDVNQRCDVEIQTEEVVVPDNLITIAEVESEVVVEDLAIDAVHDVETNPAGVTGKVEFVTPAEQEFAWLARVRELREQESPPHATEPADAESVARAFGYDPLATLEPPTPSVPRVPPLDFRKVQVGEVGYDFASVPLSKTRSELTRTSSEGCVATVFTTELRPLTPSELSPEEKNQLFVRRIRAKHLEPPKVSPFAKPLTLPKLKNHFTLKKKRDSSSTSAAWTAGNAGLGSYEMKVVEQLHSHFHHHFHLRNDLPAVSEA